MNESEPDDLAPVATLDGLGLLTVAAMAVLGKEFGDRWPIWGHLLGVVVGLVAPSACYALIWTGGMWLRHQWLMRKLRGRR